MKKNKKALSLVIVMWIVLVSWLLAIVLLETIIPFSKSVVWMENSSRAYYLANSWFEDAMYKLKENEKIINQPDIKIDSNFISINNKQSSIINLKNFSSKEPESWKWNSEFDENYNKILVWEPIQMDISWIDINNLKIAFKTPKINEKNYILSKNEIFINWQLSGEENFLNSSDKKEDNYTVFKKDDLKEFFLKDFVWIDKNWTKLSFIDAYTSFLCNFKKCVLKFSIVNELESQEQSDSSKKIILPYLEWKMWNDSNFRKRYTNISSEWLSNNYLRRLEIKVPQDTVNEAFDFTVIQ